MLDMESARYRVGRTLMHLLVDVPNWGTGSVKDAYTKLSLEIQAETLEWACTHGGLARATQAIRTRAEISRLEKP